MRHRTEEYSQAGGTRGEIARWSWWGSAHFAWAWLVPLIACSSNGSAILEGMSGAGVGGQTSGGGQPSAGATTNAGAGAAGAASGGTAGGGAGNDAGGGAGGASTMPLAGSAGAGGSVAGASAGSAGASSAGSGGALADPRAAAQVLDGFALLKPCFSKPGSCAGCTCDENSPALLNSGMAPENQHLTKRFGGDPDTTYDVTLRVAGVAERYWYSGGTLDPVSKVFYTGGGQRFTVPRRTAT
jgi:hypothetical protein